VSTAPTSIWRFYRALSNSVSLITIVEVVLMFSFNMLSKKLERMTSTQRLECHRLLGMGRNVRLLNPEEHEDSPLRHAHFSSPFEAHNHAFRVLGDVR
jgi:hypothetical protein